MINDLSDEQKDILSRIKGYCLYMTSKYPSSRRKLLDRILKSKNYEKYKILFDNNDQIELILDYMVEINLLSDYEITRARVSSRINSGWGSNKILNNVPTTLLVSRDLVQQCIDEITQNFNDDCVNDGKDLEIENILNHLRKKETIESLNDQKNTQRLFRRLVSRGFSFSKINSAMDIFKSENV